MTTKMTALEISALNVTKDGARLLADANLVAGGGEFIALVGPNGAGKSTLLRAIAGVEAQAEGAVKINGEDIAAMRPRDRARLLAYLPQTRDVHWAITAEAVASLGRFAYGAPARLGPADRAIVEAALSAADATAYRGRIMQTLSGGEQARVHLARALAAQTPILLADEPTAALDLKHALAVLAALRERALGGALVIAALHDLALARRYCTRLVVMNDGAIVDDGPADEVLSDERLAEIFGVDRTLLAGS